MSARLFFIAFVAASTVLAAPPLKRDAEARDNHAERSEMTVRDTQIPPQAEITGFMDPLCFMPGTSLLNASSTIGTNMLCQKVPGHNAAIKVTGVGCRTYFFSDDQCRTSVFQGPVPNSNCAPLILSYQVDCTPATAPPSPPPSGGASGGAMGPPSPPPGKRDAGAAEIAK